FTVSEDQRVGKCRNRQENEHYKQHRDLCESVHGTTLLWPPCNLCAAVLQPRRQVVFHGLQGQLEPCRNTHFVEDRRKMVLNGLFANRKLSGDGSVTGAGYNGRHDIQLPRRQAELFLTARSRRFL